ncbi:tetratricopeptide repeat protein [Roseisolibacter sp. H3M3-2]|uniref:tetratricopeptide repeat protein n=1 Tax=Roseisolibacter sp. H3M3-2 TaxID=3031323 RepID=UPI0023DB100E|nr:tetratricopeptide repeat protein [Roseisolibacter sp. H3M3-2]MDF1502703.1 tetratricopeptide repeat protein [Roseisolibacter sp. H3M3-2]
MADTDRLAELERKFAENPRRYFAPLANEFRKHGELAAAVQLCRDQLARFPGHMSGYVVLGQALYESRRPEEARDAFVKALDLDPENLIALRHLGDIARDAGDGSAARAWYQRVLEADPRNDDIAAQLERLSPAARMAPPAPVAQPAAFVPPPPPPPPVEPLEWSTLDLDLPGASPDIEAAVEVDVQAEAAPEPEPEIRSIEAPGLLDVDLEELGLGPVRSPAIEEEVAELPVEPAREAEVEDAPAVVAWDEFLPELPAGSEGEPDAPDLGPVEREGESDSSDASNASDETDPLHPYDPIPAVALAPVDVDSDATIAEREETEVERAVDFSEESSFEPVELTLEEEPVAEAPPADTETPAVDADELVETQPEPPYDPVVGLDLPPVEVEEEPAPVAAFEPVDAEPVPETEPSGSVPSAAFMTETMAELLLRQGHRGEALEVYDRLLVQRPDDAELRDRVSALREEPEPESTAGAFFASLVGAAAPTVEPEPEPAPEERASIDAAAEVAVVGMLAGPADADDQAAADRLAGGFEAADDDATLLVALAERGAASAAAAPPPPPVPAAPAAEPARAEEPPYGLQEFSFERFFVGLEEAPAPSTGDAPAPIPPVDDSWDFSGAPAASRTPTPASPATAVQPAPPAPDPADDDDLAQFNAWLKGLMQP